MLLNIAYKDEYVSLVARKTFMIGEYMENVKEHGKKNLKDLEEADRTTKIYQFQFNLTVLMFLFNQSSRLSLSNLEQPIIIFLSSLKPW